ncbi:YbaN family protein [Falsihalocynthiibacter sp. SS001]|uniref:YbaN family protein n=1 Tax=Falsihalocynthiibacter sp. SS001 TaxID=3349698 RepID=UPI0036D35885
MRYFWISFGTIAVGLGAIGLLLPIVPTVPFLILAAFCFARSSDRLYLWLTEHDTFGPPIQDWMERGAIEKRVKIYSTLSIGLAFIPPIFLDISPVFLVIQAVCLAAVLLFIWSRPNE